MTQQSESEPAGNPEKGAVPSLGNPPGYEVTLRRIDDLRPNPRSPRTHKKRKIEDLSRTIKALGFIGAVIVDEAGMILAGHARHAAAKLAGLTEIPTLCVQGLSHEQIRAFVLADNKYPERAGWDLELLAAELEELSVLLSPLDLDLSITGFEAGEIDGLLSDMGEDLPQEDFIPGAGPAVTRTRDLWLLRKHRLLCGDARKPNAYSRLMNGTAAAAVITDPPYNVPIGGHAQGRGRIKHPDFVVASGEMDEEQFHAFLKNCLGAAASVSRGGAVHYVFMDWRHIETLISAGRAIYEELLNIAVWNKTNPGQGSFYRSQHELIGVFRVGPGKHQNNVELGRHGRNRSNVWTYPGVSSLGAERNKILAMHPTVKPVALVADAMRDCTGRRDIVLDPFLGSGTTVIAAEKVGRLCYGLEIDPSYVDVAVRRWQDYTKADAVLEGDGRTFDEVAAERLAAGA
ncbi:hypothetical protein AMST5_00123 [freshwater sediment metagenome]|uniref:ParB-like N-terminal domain-containing protein n=1 Tax=freshwater sediment metagenome TaxID=556182 RepID=A0AA48R909_9ZZZZ